MEQIDLTPGQRRHLKRLAHHLKPLLQMGKDGPSAAFLKQLQEQVEAHELIKVRILNNCEHTREEITNGFKSAGIAMVQKVGHVYTVFQQKEEGSQVIFP